MIQFDQRCIADGMKYVGKNFWILMAGKKEIFVEHSIAPKDNGALTKTDLYVDSFPEITSKCNELAGLERRNNLASHLSLDNVYRSWPCFTVFLFFGSSSFCVVVKRNCLFD